MKSKSHRLSLIAISSMHCGIPKLSAKECYQQLPDPAAAMVAPACNRINKPVMPA